ncbi:hypothetical protein B0A79_23790 [Flavobacterium piscis]|uniref:Uncharacterized protein n=1 Tax=Flavobacterium piscis TaxID=1114874 RepID=A0ABX2XPM9_9FLAO|nr:hypothetical protein [Flavobacterium piscis]OCB75539.1 hypothetical protein FLP_08720 [Flavobacterium piscis]OXE95915.1 hypothetical protein B0A79_23790 [Flavobacterium piscis]
MHGKTISETIAILEKNSINIKIKKIEGYVVKRDIIIDEMMHFYRMSRPLKTKCMRSGLHYRFFAYPNGSICCIFTKFPEKDMYKLPQGANVKDYIIVTIFESPEDFMASPLAFFYRDKKVGTEYVSSWDEFGYYTTNSYNYNRIPLVAATNKLVRNKEIKRNPPQPPVQETNGLFLTLFG